MKESKKEKNLGKNMKKLIHAVNPFNIKKDLQTYGYYVSGKAVFAIYVLFIAGVYLLHFAFNMEFYPYTLSMMFLSALFVPSIIKYNYKRKFEGQRFEEVNQYIERTLYNFKATSKIITALKMTATSFPDGCVKDAIVAASKLVISEGPEAALHYMEEKYNTSYVKKMNELMLNVERNGGEFEDSLDIQLEFRRTWEQRTKDFQKQKENKNIYIIAGMIMATIIVAIMENVLVYALPNKNGIAHMPIVEIGTIAFVLLNIMLYTFVAKKLSTSLLEPTKSLSDEKIKEYYRYICSTDKKKLKNQVIKKSIFGLILIGGTYLLVKKDIAILLVVSFLAFFIAVSPFVKYSSRRKAIQREIMVAFPRWLENVALLKQTSSVQVALRNSLDTAPVVLQPELRKMLNALHKDPTSSTPYFDFMSDFHISFITSTMQMLEAISSGKGGDEKKQTRELLEFNGRLLDEEERITNENHMAGFLILEWMPSVIASFKMVIDMVIFLTAFMGSFQSFI